MKVSQLKEWLRKYDLPVSGKKTELIKRIKGFTACLDREDNDSCNVSDDYDDTGSIDSSNDSDGSSKSCSDDRSYRSVDSDSGSDGSNKSCSDDGSSFSVDSNSYSDGSSNNSTNGSGSNYSSRNISSDGSSGNTISGGDTNANTERIPKKKDVKTTERIHNRKKLNPLVHIAQSTFNFKAKANARQRATHSKLGYCERVKVKNESNVKRGNQKFLSKRLSEVSTLTCSGLFCCDATDKETQNRCMAGPFSSKKALNHHKEKVARGLCKHTFPSINSLTKTTIDVMSGKWALSLACGSMTNRDRAVSATCVITPPLAIKSDDRVPKYWMECGCYRRDNKKWKKKPYRASKALNEDLEALFVEGEKITLDGLSSKTTKYTAVEAVSVLRNMVDKDGHRKYRLGGPNGAPPDVAFVRARFSKRKRNGVKALVNHSNSDKYDRMAIKKLQALYKAVFDGEQPTQKNVLSKILEMDDNMKNGGHDDVYSSLSSAMLQKECKHRNLPFKLGKQALKTVLRANDKEMFVLARRSNSDFRDASDLASASSTQNRILNKL